MQRLLIALLILIAPTIAIAKPKVAIAPFVGDSDNEYADAVADILDGTVKVTSVADTKKAMSKLDLSGELETGDAKKLASKLKVDAIVQGSISKKGAKKTLVLKVFNGGKSSTKKITVKSPASLKKEKDDVIAAVDGMEEQKDEDAEKAEREKAEKEKEKAEREAKREKKEKGEGDGKKEKGEGDGEKKEKGEGDVDGDGDSKGKRHKGKRVGKGGDGDGDEIHEGSGDEGSKGEHSLGPAFRVDAGGSFGLRRLTYDSTAQQPPPPTGTTTPGAHVELEVFPFAFDGKKGGAAGLGIVGDFDRAVGLSITIPKSMTTVPITQQHYSIAARYRLGVGAASALGFGVGYARRSYIANRTGLNGTVLDTPDVDNQAIAVHVWMGIPVASSATFIGEVRGLGLLSAGPIAKRDGYGAATAYGAELKTGVDIALGGSFGLRLAAEFSQVSYSFKGGNQNPNQRGVTGAADRSLGINATLGMTY